MIRIEPITDSNIAGVWELYQRNVPEFDRLPFEWFKYKVLGDPDPDPELTLVAMDGNRPVAFMDALCRTQDSNSVGWVKAWATDADRRGEGLASALLQRVETRLCKLGVTKVCAGQSKPNYITPGIDASAYTPAVGFLLRRGFKRTGINYNMDVPLAGRTFVNPEVESRLKDKDIIIRRVEKDEKARFESWVKEAGWGYSWQYQSAAAMDADPSGAFIAEKDGEITGFAVYDAVRPGWFGPTGTLESMRGSGIGSALFLRCLDDMREKGYPVCYICSVGPLYFYSKVINAVVSRTFWAMEKMAENG